MANPLVDYPFSWNILSLPCLSFLASQGEETSRCTIWEVRRIIWVEVRDNNHLEMGRAIKQTSVVRELWGLKNLLTTPVFSWYWNSACSQFMLTAWTHHQLLVTWGTTACFSLSNFGPQGSGFPLLYTFEMG